MCSVFVRYAVFFFFSFSLFLQTSARVREEQLERDGERENGAAVDQRTRRRSIGQALIREARRRKADRGAIH